MQELRFDGLTAIVTGAGGNPSLGRAHALLLGKRGANVVVNDIGKLPPEFDYPGESSAEAVAEEIRTAGGKAVADTHSVEDEDGGEALIETALSAFGSADVIINNAGICRVVGFEDMTPGDFAQLIDVNLMGTVRVCRAAWPHMKARGYGRIVNVASGSMSGYAWQSAYAAAKGGVYSFTRVLAVEGADYGIKANTLMPGALTRMVLAAQSEDSSFIEQANAGASSPEIVSPTVVFLAHESVPFSGEAIESIGGRVRRFYLARTDGFTDTAMTPETLAARWPDIMAGTAEGISLNTETDPRLWSPRPYRPLA